jgi:hypothetical protein
MMSPTTMSTTFPVLPIATVVADLRDHHADEGRHQDQHVGSPIVTWPHGRRHAAERDAPGHGPQAPDGAAASGFCPDICVAARSTFG